MPNLREHYNELNNSFKKTLVFHLGADAGFFSEYNNMILTMLYCLEHKIRFILYSGNANFGHDKGWKDYFLPFCDEETEKFHAKYNFRYPGIFKILRPQVLFYHLLHRNCLLTYEVLPSARKDTQKQKQYYIPELGIDGGVQDACCVLVELTWKYNLQTEDRIKKLLLSLKLPERYAGLHIRGGDKSKEATLQPVSDYIEKLSAVYDGQNIFVLTDDYCFINELKDKSFFVYTLCEKNERGYFHKAFEKNDKLFIKQSHEKLFASIEALSQAQCFIGTFSSNPGMYMGMRMSKDKIFGIDLDKWQIW